MPMIPTPTNQNRRTIPIYDILKVYIENESTDFAITHNDNTLYTSAQVLIELVENYAEYFMSVPEMFAENAGGHFKTVWQNFLSLRIDNFAAAFAALNAEYNPISNYDMTETAADGEKRDTETRTSTPTGTTTVETDSKINGFDSVTPADAGTVTATTSYQNAVLTDTTTPTNTKTMSFEGTEHSGYNKTNEHFLKRSGNIGVTTSQQMIESELQLRQHELLSDLLKKFADRYLFFAG